MPKKDPNKPRGRMTGYAYFVQTCREEHRKKHPSEQVVFAEFSRKCATRWKDMSDKEKKTFNEMAEKDRIRYEVEMKNYHPPEGKQRKKKKKDPNAPKRPQSAFFLFCADRRANLKAANPSWSVGEIAKDLGRQWADAKPELKKKYSEQGEKEKEKYNREMAKYKQQQSGGPQAKKQKMAKKAVASSESESSEESSEGESD